ncbi:hypothetical protein HYPSUDRAFT_140963 [Hypholoma sublateritium FD-334 SS-4]|uniref:Peptidase A1 domain-containing protein n=1 Tax=Hypholoma sublateritium (strain FD-334 SS-4) TaxID=945553 RepID=A0A0D2NR54_HYPSF|nr:hypothetical protein HYPSUDRAFT_140963 [Hypholoma sublateritium FD-334 SS-4]
MAQPSLVFLLFLVCIDLIQAYHFKFRGSHDISSGLASRANAETQIAGSVMLSNKGDVSYYADIVVGAQTFTVLVDTGSSDLWVAGTVLKSTPTGQNASIKYAANSVTGSIKRANVQFAGQQVIDQAFLEIQPGDNNLEGHGILGLGPASGSFISKDLPLGTGETLLNRIFTQNSSTANFFTLLLGRNNDPSTFFEGSVTVGEVLSDYKAILGEPRMPVTSVVESDHVDQHLQVLLDPNGIINSDGIPIPIKTAVEQTVNKDQATVVFDSGFTLPQFPRAIVDQIYGRYAESEYREVPGFGGVYVLPCEQEVNLTLKFFGKSYPMHPLDMTMDPTSVNLSALETADGQNACIGTFQPFTYTRGNFPSYDIVLGMSFLRNVYSFFNFGKYTQNSTTIEEPYIQLLSITDLAEAHSDFVTIRLGGIDTTASRKLIPTTSSSSKHRTTYYIVAGVLGALVLSAIVAFTVLRSARRR